MNKNQKMPHPLITAIVILFIVIPLLLLIRVEQPMWDKTFTVYVPIASAILLVVGYHLFKKESKKEIDLE